MPCGRLAAGSQPLGTASPVRPVLGRTRSGACPTGPRVWTGLGHGLRVRCFVSSGGATDPSRKQQSIAPTSSDVAPADGPCVDRKKLFWRSFGSNPVSYNNKLHCNRVFKRHGSYTRSCHFCDLMGVCWSDAFSSIFIPPRNERSKSTIISSRRTTASPVPCDV